MHKCKAFMVLGCIFSLTTEIVWAQQKDSLLPEVKVVARRSYTSTNTSMPLQILDRQRLKLLNSTNVADAVKYFSGVLVKDYGGIGGLKTVSVRSLGAAHTGVLYDGVVLADAQAGQIDLGRYPIENLQSISLQNAQPAEILNTARSFTSASILQIKTLAMADSIGNGIVAGLKAGSFKMMNPFALLQKRINNHWGLMANGEWLSSSGNYPFVDYENNQQSRLRMNSDIKSFNGSVDLSYQKSEKERFNLKGYFYHAERGLPGSIILYNHFSADRLKDKNFFLQTGYKTKVGKRDAVLLNGKYSYLLNQYFQPLGGQNYENVFHQKEYYFSTVWKHSFSNWLEAAWAGDYFFNALSRTDVNVENENFPFPKRNTLLQNWALKAVRNRGEIQLSMLHSAIFNTVKTGESAKNFKRLAPTISAVFQPWVNWPLKMRAFYKNTFRVPTFNDLYYTRVGNTKLRPEVAQQYNLGLTYIASTGNLFKKVSVTTDVYHNNVTDKIVAVPRENLFQWSMQNLGKVKINGLDLTTFAQLEEWKQWRFEVYINYSYQRALDQSDATSVLFNKQIAYTPLHSGSFRFSAQRSKVSLSYNMLWSGSRYRIGEEIPENYLPSWATHDLNLRYNWEKSGFKYEVFAEANNILNRQYEIIIYYPMPRFSWRIGAKVGL